MGKRKPVPLAFSRFRPKSGCDSWQAIPSPSKLAGFLFAKSLAVSY